LLQFIENNVTENISDGVYRGRSFWDGILCPVLFVPYL